MLSPTTGWLRGMRAASLGVAGLVLALVAHLAAGGAAPGPVVLVLLAWLTALAAVLLTSTRLSPVRLGMSLICMQLVLHEAFMRLGAPVDCVMAAVAIPTGGHSGHGGPAMLDCATGMAMAGAAPRSVFMTTSMVGAHAVATALMAALLACGERVLWFLTGCVRAPRCLRLPLPEPRLVHVVPWGASRVLRGQFASGGVGLRGPPFQSLVAII